MASEYFDFKQFRVYHSQCAMKVGTDSVLLGCLIPMQENVSSILDIGTGSGIIALLMAQRFPLAQVDAIEIETAASLQAKGNFEQSKWSARLSLTEVALQTYVPNKTYEIIVSNPPFFASEHSYEMANSARKSARYTHHLTHMELIQKAVSMLADDGTFYVVLPDTIANEFVKTSLGFGLNQVFEVAINMKPNGPISRYILGFKKCALKINRNTFTVYDALGKRSDAYSKISSAFYL